MLFGTCALVLTLILLLVYILELVPAMICEGGDGAALGGLVVLNLNILEQIHQAWTLYGMKLLSTITKDARAGPSCYGWVDSY
jgi:hypothetical protein